MNIDTMIESFKRTVACCCPNWFNEHENCDLVPVSAMTLNQTLESSDRLNDKVKQVLDEVNGLRVSWDLWEMNDGVNPNMAIFDFMANSASAICNKRIQFCATPDEFMSEMMRLSLSHEILEMKVVKNISGSHGIIMILFCLDGDGQTNIDADLIDRLAWCDLNTMMPKGELG
jgi:hypothetical protein